MPKGARTTKIFPPTRIAALLQQVAYEVLIILHAHFGTVDTRPNPKLSHYGLCSDPDCEQESDLIAFSAAWRFMSLS
jgi:hypothetical protein